MRKSQWMCGVESQHPELLSEGLTCIALFLIPSFVLTLLQAVDMVCAGKAGVLLAIIAVVMWMTISAVPFAWSFCTAIALKILDKSRVPLDPSALTSPFDRAGALFKCSILLLVRLLVPFLAYVVLVSGLVMTYTFFLIKKDYHHRFRNSLDGQLMLIASLMLMSMAFIAWGVKVWLDTCLAPCLVMDRHSASNAMQSSKVLVRGSRLRMLLLSIATYGLVVVLPYLFATNAHFAFVIHLTLSPLLYVIAPLVYRSLGADTLRAHSFSCCIGESQDIFLYQKGRVRDPELGKQ